MESSFEFHNTLTLNSQFVCPELIALLIKQNGHEHSKGKDDDGEKL